jgi:hypothetical protein
MGLDEDINYVRLSEVNRFEWPSDRIKPLLKNVAGAVEIINLISRPTHIHEPAIRFVATAP